MKLICLNRESSGSSESLNRMGRTTIMIKKISLASLMIIFVICAAAYPITRMVGAFYQMNLPNGSIKVIHNI